jgi:hypothetical protein
MAHIPSMLIKDGGWYHVTNKNGDVYFTAVKKPATVNMGNKFVNSMLLDDAAQELIDTLTEVVNTEKMAKNKDTEAMMVKDTPDTEVIWLGLTEVSNRTNIKTGALREIYKKHNLKTMRRGNGIYITEKDYLRIFNVANTEENESIDRFFQTKTEFKHKAKEKVKRKFVVGELISLKTKSKCGSKEVIKGYKVIKFFYTINDIETNAVVVKQIYGPQSQIYTLNIHDCQKLHIKYEPGLQVFSMNLNWGKFKPNLYQ